MTDSNYTHIAVVVDRSGSMFNIANDMKGGLEEFFKSQNLDGQKTLVDYVQFDEEYDVVYSDVPVDKAQAYLVPRGRTALVDAVGKTITTLGDKLARKSEDERPGQVIVVIVTDGMENASTEWNADQVRELVNQQKSQWNWEFVFLGANIDAVEVGQSLGFDAGASLTYTASSRGVGMATASLGAYTSQLRGGHKRSFTESDRKAASGS